MEKLHPQESTESQNKVLRRFCWTNTLPSDTEKQAIEDILVDYHDIFARYRKDIGKNTEFKVKLTPKDDKAVHSQSLPMPIHLKEDLNVELANAQVWNHHSTAFLQVREPHICTKEARRKYTSPCGSTENQQSDCR